MELRSFGKVVLPAALAALLSACATTRAPDARDPWEVVNRATFDFNDKLDRAVLKPVAEGYRAVLPGMVRAGVSNFFANLQDPWIAVNQLFQGKVEDALSDAWRFIANSTFGIGGIFDIASDMRMAKHREDFGQTLAVWGVSFGPYLVLPVIGPSSLRDGTALLGVDSFAYVPWHGPEWVDAAHRVTWRTTLTATDVIQVRAGLLDATTALEQAALDQYVFVRNAYFQRRRNLIYDGEPPPEPLAAEPEDIEEAPASPSTSIEEAPPRPHTFIEPKIPANYESVLKASGPPPAARR